MLKYFILFPVVCNIVVVFVVFSIFITSFIPELQNGKINLIVNWCESESVCGATVSCDFSGAVDLQLFPRTPPVYLIYLCYKSEFICVARVNLFVL